MIDYKITNYFFLAKVIWTILINYMNKILSH